MDNGEPFQVIDEDGNFNDSGFENFIKKVRLEQYGLSYSVVSIMGSQSSGKSTLLNKLFGTSFEEMHLLHRRRTTKGIWFAKSVHNKSCTIVVDIEGTDSGDRGEDTLFQKKSALFALAISDVVIVNLWTHDTNRVEALNVPLLRTMFEGVLRLLRPRKTTLILVVRDKTRTPSENLEDALRVELQKIWDSAKKGEAHKETRMDEFFNVEFITLCNYERKEKQFKEEVDSFRQWFSNAVAHDGLLGDKKGVVPANQFALSTKKIWQLIDDQRDLELPKLTVMVATVRCLQIVEDIISRFKVWLQLEVDAKPDSITGSGQKLESILRSSLLEFDNESKYMDNDVKSTKRKILQEKMLHLVEPTIERAIKGITTKVFKNFEYALENALNSNQGFTSSANYYIKSCKTQFDQTCKEIVIEQTDWGISTIWKELLEDIHVHMKVVSASRLPELIKLQKSQLEQALSGPVKSLLHIADDKTWPSIRKLLTRELELAVAGLGKALSDFQINAETQRKKVDDLEEYAYGVVKETAVGESAKVVRHMIDRFKMIFNGEVDSYPRRWTKTKDIKKMIKIARSKSLKMLSVMALCRLDDEDDNVEEMLSSALIDDKEVDSMYSTIWVQVAPRNTLISPLQCRSCWLEFKKETKYLIDEAISTQEANKGCPWVTIFFCIAISLALYVFLKGITELLAVIRDIMRPGRGFFYPR